MTSSPLLCQPRAAGLGLLVLLLLGLFRPSLMLGARLIKEPRRLGAPSPPLAEVSASRGFRQAETRGEAAGAMQELARALAHVLEAERQERARAEAQEVEDQQTRVLAQLLHLWDAPHTSDLGLGQDDDPSTSTAQLTRALLHARLDPTALAVQLVPVLRTRPRAYYDSTVGPDAKDAGEEAPDVDAELLRYLLGQLLTGSPDLKTMATPRRLRRAADRIADQDLGPELLPEGVLGALLRVKRLDPPARQVPMHRFLPP
ncbi:PREDICTED: proSAAS [Elephantulus edwardii]|uniref:proSAAS n=1 Tax=Elephantulus edwardii TaxID=28737 RepID=UPI0003F0BAA8|nr:PREDICTED: proSAAS [Elephantulus edwardii]